VGAAVTDVSLVVVVVVVAGSVVQDDKAMAQAGITGIRRISFFIVDLMLTMDSPPVVPTDGLRASFFRPGRSGLCVSCCSKPQVA
jgi:hypothetical protein